MLMLECVSDANPDILTGYTDTNWACNIDNYYSTSGYIFKLGDTIISWNNKKQAMVATLSTEAKYIAVSHGAKQAMWLHQLPIHSDIARTPPPPTTHYVDNTSTISLTKEPCFHSHTHHTPIHYHFIHELVKNNTLNIKYIPTADMLTNGFTKPLTCPRHLFFIDRLYLCSDWGNVLEIQLFIVVTYISLFGMLGQYTTCSPYVQVFPSSPLHLTGGKHYIHSYTCSLPAHSLGTVIMRPLYSTEAHQLTC